MSVERTGCRDCKECSRSGVSGGIAKMGRGYLALGTVGISSLVRASRKKCGQCGHPRGVHEEA